MPKVPLAFVIRSASSCRSAGSIIGFSFTITVKEGAVGLLRAWTTVCCLLGLSLILQMKVQPSASTQNMPWRPAEQADGSARENHIVLTER